MSLAAKAAINANNVAATPSVKRALAQQKKRLKPAAPITATDAATAIRAGRAFPTRNAARAGRPATTVAKATASAMRRRNNARPTASPTAPASARASTTAAAGHVNSTTVKAAATPRGNARPEMPTMPAARPVRNVPTAISSVRSVKAESVRDVRRTAQASARVRPMAVAAPAAKVNATAVATKVNASLATPKKHAAPPEGRAPIARRNK